MGHESHGNGEAYTPKAGADLEDRYSGGPLKQPHADFFDDEIDSTSSTPFVSAPSSPGRGFSCGAYFFSAPASPMHYILSNPAYSVSSTSPAAQNDASLSGSFEFEFSAKYASIASSSNAGSMTSADELFLNGQIRPMKLSSHLECPQSLAPLADVYEEESSEIAEPDGRGRDLKMRSRSIHRRTRSMSPLRNARFQWQEEDDVEKNAEKEDPETEQGKGSESLTPSASSSSSRSSSSGRNSKRWVFLKDLLYRSKSEGRANAKEKFWHSISFSPSKDKSKPPPTASSSSAATPPPNLCSEPSQTQTKKNCAGSSSSTRTKKTGSSSSTASPKPAPGTGKRRLPTPSPHERLYTANRAQMEELRKRTFLPYRQGLLGCLGFSSRGYGAINGFAKSLNPVSSR